jgi:Bacterial PH domain
MVFKASFDWMVKIITATFCLFFLIFTVLGTLNVEKPSMPTIPVIGLLVILVVYLLHVQHYEVTHEGIKIKRLIGSKVIDFNSIKHINRLKDDDLGVVIRTFGNGGIFGFIGIHRSSIYGKITVLATQQRNYVIVETDLKKYVLTPDEPFDFVKSVENRVGVV